MEVRGKLKSSRKVISSVQKKKGIYEKGRLMKIRHIGGGGGREESKRERIC